MRYFLLTKQAYLPILGIFILILITTLSFNQLIINNRNNKSKSAPAPTPAAVDESEQIIRSYFDQQKKQYISIIGKKMQDGSYKISYELYGGNVTFEGQKYFYDTDFFEFTPKNHPMLTLIEEKKSEKLLNFDYKRSTIDSLVSWAPSGNMFALYLDNQIGLFKIEEGSRKSSDGTVFSTRNIQLVAQIPVSSLGKSVNSLFFSGDDSELYVVIYEPIYDEVHIVTSSYGRSYATFRVDLLDSRYQPTFVALEVANQIPKSAGYVTFTSKNTTNSDLNLSFHYPNHTNSIPVAPADYPGKILVSPLADKVCYEKGSSGYWGYTVLDIKKQIVIEEGFQYSYCDRWLNNDELLLIENPYNSGKRGGVGESYIFNTTTKKKTFLHIIKAF